MTDSLITTFHQHLHACGMAASTQERYVACVLRLFAFSGVPAEAVTSAHAYAHLIDQSNRLGLSASWYAECGAIPSDQASVKQDKRPNWTTPRPRFVPGMSNMDKP